MSSPENSDRLPASNGNGDRSKISRETIEKLYDLGFEPIPLEDARSRNKPAIEYKYMFQRGYGWENKEEMLQYLDKFENVAALCGVKSHLKDPSGKDVIIVAIDIDAPQVVQDLSKVQPELQSITTSTISFLDLCKNMTLVTQTRRGYHIYFKCTVPIKPIRKSDCYDGYDIEIKSNKTLITLPGSHHRDDPSFQYKRVDKCGSEIKIMDGDRAVPRLLNFIMSSAI